MRPVTGPTNKGCYCLCSVAHPKADGVCEPNNAVTTRDDARGRPVQMCAACAAQHDQRHAPKKLEVAEPRDLDSRLTALVKDAMPAEDAELAGGALAAIREAWSGGDFYADPRQALEVIADNCNDLLALLNAAAKASEVA